MSVKNETEVIIGGKSYTLSGHESEEYLQRVALYINNKVSEYSKIDSFRKQSVDYQQLLLLLNTADDFFRMKKKVLELEQELEKKEKEVYDLKHELISDQIKQENMEKKVANMQSEINEYIKKVAKLEANS